MGWIYCYAFGNDVHIFTHRIICTTLLYNDQISKTDIDSQKPNSDNNIILFSIWVSLGNTSINWVGILFTGRHTHFVRSKLEIKHNFGQILHTFHVRVYTVYSVHNTGILLYTDTVQGEVPDIQLRSVIDIPLHYLEINRQFFLFVNNHYSQLGKFVFIYFVKYGDETSRSYVFVCMISLHKI